MSLSERQARKELGMALGAIAANQGQRVGQLLVNAVGTRLKDSGLSAVAELFYMPDEALLECVKAYARSKQHDGSSTT